MQKEALKQQKLGQYHLEEKLGEGGMGVVYRGRHALLRRPTAIKLLHVTKTNEASIARFEREVQLTSQLNHPNTIAIYDFGRTPEGIFYYAMEFLDGLDLERLVDRYGPMPEARTIHILLQVCGSLAEAHALGLVHRDIKPANIYLCQRGGMTDFVKVLDFGLVKALDAEKVLTLTAADSITGTPMYIAPEGIENPSLVDTRSDLYAVGAVGYFLLTGKQPFNAANVVELCMKVVNEAPIPPSQLLGKPITAELERIILCCLAKKQDSRFASANELADALRSCKVADEWTEAVSADWWQEHSDRLFGKSAAPTPREDQDTRTMIWSDVKKEQ
jgi:serine/threonine protein kinase